MARIVFVVGAGASKDLCESMPVGSDLAESIESLLNADLRPGEYGPVSKAIMRSHPGLGDEQTQAMRRIRDSILSQDSIDDFLSEWREVPFIDDVAKIAIAHLILDAERRSTLCMDSASDADRTTRLRQFNPTWIGQILRRPLGRRRDIDAVLKDVAFVVFNYDRILEHYLYLYLTRVTGRTADEATRLLKSFAIIHPYGSLGDITAPGQSTPFGAPEPQTAAAAKGIRTYNESHLDADVRAVRQVIYSAKKLVFLGCAYHDQNINLLFGDGESDASKPQIFGTSFGMREQRRREEISRLSKYGSVMNFDPLKCADFVQQNDEAIFS
jgi:hypothetical protein